MEWWSDGVAEPSEVLAQEEVSPAWKFSIV